MQSCARWVFTTSQSRSESACHNPRTVASTGVTALNSSTDTCQRTFLHRHGGRFMGSAQQPSGALLSYGPRRPAVVEHRPAVGIDHLWAVRHSPQSNRARPRVSTKSVNRFFGVSTTRLNCDDAIGRIIGEVTPLQRYIAEEIATDHVDGLRSRREALRRLALLGMGTAAATALIAACGENKTTTSNAPVTSSGAATSSAPPPGSAKA